MHWMYNYLGKPWAHEYDCFRHFAQVQSEIYKRDKVLELPDLPDVLDYDGAKDYVSNHEIVNELWEEVDSPEEGDAIIFGSDKLSFHVGTYVNEDGGGVLHCDHRQGVQFTSMRSYRMYGIKFQKILRYKE